MIVFAYGTLTVDIVRDRVLGHPVDTRDAVLRGYSKDAVLRGYSKVCGWDYLTLVPSDSSVRGVVFEADADDVARMDVWEDVPVYSLVPVTVETDDGPVEAHTYIMGAGALRDGGRLLRGRHPHPGDHGRPGQDARPQATGTPFAFLISFPLRGFRF